MDRPDVEVIRDHISRYPFKDRPSCEAHELIRYIRHLEAAIVEWDKQWGEENLYESASLEALSQIAVNIIKSTIKED